MTDRPNDGPQEADRLPTAEELRERLYRNRHERLYLQRLLRLADLLRRKSESEGGK